MKKSLTKRKSYTPNKQKQKVVNSPQVQKILALKDSFHKNIQLPIQNIQSIQHSKSTQRCLIHNTVLTLYCELDRKTLCANCMYQQETHRKHRVIPIGRAINLVKQDIMGFEIKLEDNLRQCSVFSRKLQQMIIKSQRYYPSVVKQLRQYYSSMIKMLQQKQNEQISQIQQQQQKMKVEVLLLDQQVKKIATAINMKLKPTKKIQTEQSLLTRRGVLQTLTKVNKYIHHDMANIFQEDQNHKIIDFNIYENILQMVKSRLIVILPGISVQPRKSAYGFFSPRSVTPRRKPNTNGFTSPNKKSPIKTKSIQNNKQAKIKKQVTFNL